jgi:hypothetical protein
VYKVGDVEPWVASDGFVLRAHGITDCTRWYVCDKLVGDDGDANDDPKSPFAATTTERWFVVRGAAWNNEAVDRFRLSAQIAKMWPTPLHPGVPAVCHAGVAEMTDAFWQEISLLIAAAPMSATLHFTGHSLGGSMATMLAAWARLRLGVDPAKVAPVHTFGSPPVLALDGWELRKRRGNEAAGGVARAVRLLPIRPRSRDARRSLRTFPVVTLHPRFPFNV